MLLPTFLGKEALDPKVDFGSSSSHALVKGSKAFACSRGSQLRTFSGKDMELTKETCGFKYTNFDNVPTSPDIGGPWSNEGPGERKVMLLLSLNIWGIGGTLKAVSVRRLLDRTQLNIFFCKRLFLMNKE